jgi:hypothetical protein
VHANPLAKKREQLRLSASHPTRKKRGEGESKREDSSGGCFDSEELSFERGDHDDEFAGESVSGVCGAAGTFQEGYDDA